MGGDLARRVTPLAASGDFTWVAALLENARDEILGRWLAVTCRQPFHDCRLVSHVEDHIPPLFDGLVAVLRRHAPQGDAPGDLLANPAVFAAAKAHALARFQQGLGAPDIAAEFRILRQEIGRALRLHLSDSVPATDVVAAELLVHDALDGATWLALSMLDAHETERRRAEAALRASEERFRLLVETVQDYAIILLDAHGRVATWNAGAERITGYTAETIVGQPYATFFRPEDRAAQRVEQLLRAAAAQGRAQDEGWRQRRDGTCFWVETALSAMRDEDGRLTGYASISRDMTERRRLLESEQAARVAAEAALRVRDDILATVAHDLKTPLTAIRATAELLAINLARDGRPDPERLIAALDRIQGAAQRMGGMMDELLDAARLEQGQPLDLHREPTDLTALAREAAADFPARLHRVRASVAETELCGAWDAVRLRRVIDNLLSNAVKYSPPGSEVELAARREGAWAVLEVRDRGIGIPAADLPHVYELFRRGSNAPGVARGTGVGLAAARHIVEQHGGSLHLDSREGEGTTVVVRLPLGSAEQSAA